MLFSVQNEVFFSNFVRKQNVESENFPINPINVFLSDLRVFFLLPVRKTLVSTAQNTISRAVGVDRIQACQRNQQTKITPNAKVNRIRQQAMQLLYQQYWRLLCWSWFIFKEMLKNKNSFYQPLNHTIQIAYIGAP